MPINYARHSLITKLRAPCSSKGVHIWSISLLLEWHIRIYTESDSITLCVFSCLIIIIISSIYLFKNRTKYMDSEQDTPCSDKISRWPVIKKKIHTQNTQNIANVQKIKHMRFSTTSLNVCITDTLRSIVTWDNCIRYMSNVPPFVSANDRTTHRRVWPTLGCGMPSIAASIHRVRHNVTPVFSVDFRKQLVILTQNFTHLFNVSNCDYLSNKIWLISTMAKHINHSDFFAHLKCCIHNGL